MTVRNPSELLPLQGQTMTDDSAVIHTPFLRKSVTEGVGIASVSSVTRPIFLSKKQPFLEIRKR